MYNHLTVCKQIADVELLVLCNSAWSHFIVYKQVVSGLFRILSTKFSFGNLRFNMCINKI